MDDDERIARLEIEIRKLRRATTLLAIGVFIFAIGVFVHLLVVRDRMKDIFELFASLSIG